MELHHAKAWNHIIHGDARGGGHLPHYGWRNGRTVEYPAGFKEGDVAGVVASNCGAALRQAEASAGRGPTIAGDVSVPGVGVVRFVFTRADPHGVVTVYPVGGTATGA